MPTQIANVGFLKISSRTMPLRSAEKASMHSLIPPTPGSTSLSADLMSACSDEILTEFHQYFRTC